MNISLWSRTSPWSVVPRGEADVEPRVLLHQFGVNRVNQPEPPVRARQERVQHGEPQIDFALRHRHRKPSLMWSARSASGFRRPLAERADHIPNENDRPVAVV